MKSIIISPFIFCFIILSVPELNAQSDNSTSTSSQTKKSAMKENEETFQVSQPMGQFDLLKEYEEDEKDKKDEKKSDRAPVVIDLKEAIGSDPVPTPTLYTNEEEEKAFGHLKRRIEERQKEKEQISERKIEKTKILLSPEF